MLRKLAIAVLAAILVLLALPVFTVAAPATAPSGNDHQWQCESWASPDGTYSFCYRKFEAGRSGWDVYELRWNTPCSSGFQKYMDRAGVVRFIEHYRSKGCVGKG